MSIRNKAELEGMKKISTVVATVLREMVAHAQAGQSTLALDHFGEKILKNFGARSAPKRTYNFPGCTCISVNKAFCHGIPSSKIILQNGDLVNIDVSAELDGFWADNGASFVLGNDKNGHQQLVDASNQILNAAISQIKAGMRIAETGKLIEEQAKIRGFKVVRNLAGHGVGRSLHEKPFEIANYYDRFNFQRYKEHDVVAIETFISTNAEYAVTTNDGWTMVGDKGGYMAQHEHTIVVTKDTPIILTKANGV
jgi:methionyl aminopeptidase